MLPPEKGIPNILKFKRLLMYILSPSKDYSLSPKKCPPYFPEPANVLLVIVKGR
jgi:hypothetical protein